MCYDLLRFSLCSGICALRELKRDNDANGALSEPAASLRFARTALEPVVSLLSVTSLEANATAAAELAKLRTVCADLLNISAKSSVPPRAAEDIFLEDRLTNEEAASMSIDGGEEQPRQEETTDADLDPDDVEMNEELLMAGYFPAEFAQGVRFQNEALPGVTTGANPDPNDVEMSEELLAAATKLIKEAQRREAGRETSRAANRPATSSRKQGTALDEKDSEAAPAAVAETAAAATPAPSLGNTIERAWSNTMGFFAANDESKVVSPSDKSTPKPASPQDGESGQQRKEGKPAHGRVELRPITPTRSVQRTHSQNGAGSTTRESQEQVAKQIAVSTDAISRARQARQRSSPGSGGAGGMQRANSAGQMKTMARREMALARE